MFPDGISTVAFNLDSVFSERLGSDTWRVYRFSLPRFRSAFVFVFPIGRFSAWFRWSIERFVSPKMTPSPSHPALSRYPSGVSFSQ